MARRAALFLAALSVAACDRPPLAWQEAMRAPRAPGPAWRLAVDAHGQPALGTAPTVPFVAPPGACATSVVFTRAGGGVWFVAWWQPRADSSAQLLVSRSANGGATWSAPAVADGRDRSPLGCARPHPSIAADSATGAVHLAYFVVPQQGAGVWYVHSPDAGASWRGATGVFYGTDPAAADVAVRGDTVLVAYEYPDADDARIGVALSYTAGRDFPVHMPVSPGTERAADPRAALGAGTAAVAWVAGGRDAAATVVDIAALGGGT